MNFPTNPKANYTNDASKSAELTIKPGDVQDVEQLQAGWWLKGRPGMFPDNFVSIINNQSNSGPTRVQGYCRAVFSYQPVNSDELPLSVGDVLEVLDEVEEGWWQGRRQGLVGVFPSNFVVMLEPPPAHSVPPFEPPPAHSVAPFEPPASTLPTAPPSEPAPALPPKPIKECCRVLFPYTAVNDDELTLEEGDIVTLVSKETSDRGWWRGELYGHVGLFPDNFVQLLPNDPTSNKISPPEDESKPERPPAKTAGAVYPVLNKYFEMTASVKELTTSKISMQKDSTINKESSTQTTVTNTNKSESEKLVHSNTTTDGAPDAALKFSDEEIYGSKFSVPKKPSIPLKKSPTPTSGVGGLFSGLKSKMMPSSDKDKSEKHTPNLSSGNSNGGEWDRTDGGAGSKPAATTTVTTTTANVTVANSSTFDQVERNSILNDPRSRRAKAPRRRPPSQALRDDTPQQIGLSNGHEVPVEKPPPDKAEAVKPRTREWEKHKAPWMEELKLNQAKKTSFVADGKSRSVSASSEAGASRAGSTDRTFSSRRHKTGSYHRILDCGLEEKRSTHSMEMSKSTSSISSRISVLESLDSSLETKGRHSLETKKETSPAAREPEPPAPPTSRPPTLHSPTAAGRTLTSMLDDIKKPPAPPPPIVVRADLPNLSPNKVEKIVTSSERVESSTTKLSGSVVESSHKSSTVERTEEKVLEKEKPLERSPSALGDRSSTLERRHLKPEKVEGADALIAQLNSRILNLEKLIEVQNVKFNAAIEHLSTKLSLETEKRLAMQAEIEKLAQCVTQV